MLRWFFGLLLLGFSPCLFAQDVVDIDTEEPVKMTLEEALLIALENNISLQIDRLDPQITELGEDIAKAAFDTGFDAGVTYTDDEVTNVDGETRSANDIIAGAGLTQRLPSGTRLNLDVDFRRDEPTAVNQDDKRYTDSVNTELRITQALLQGRGRDVGLASIRRAQIGTDISRQQLRRFIETLIYNVTVSYWDLFLEQQKLKVYQESYALAVEHQREVEVFILNGKRPEIELATVQAEVSSRRERLIKSRGDIDKVRLSLISIMNYQTLTPRGWDEKILPTDDPQKTYDEPDDVDTYVAIAMLKRPEIRESELRLERDQVDLIVTKNGLLPRLDFFITLGNTEFANSFKDGNDTENDEQYAELGLNYSFSFGRRAEKARYLQDRLTEEQSNLALSNLKDTINREIRRAYIDCMTNLQSIEAVTATLELRRQALNTQKIKFEHGEATNNAIANAQRDLLESEINHTEAIVDYVLSRMRLHYLDGSLIERLGLDVP
ncbi:MAG: TolC family protein [Verrucomicrobiae bacterium]|nr:TolC family protein [Verrucomicrobiae bacterium]